MAKAIEQEILIMRGLSPDGRWILAWARLAGGGTGVQAFPLDGGAPVVILGRGRVAWSPDGRSFSIIGGRNALIPLGRSYLVPLAPGQALPKIPVDGFNSEEEVARLPGVRRIEEMGVAPSPSPDVYAFSRGATQRNLYRIPIP